MMLSLCMLIMQIMQINMLILQMMHIRLSPKNKRLVGYLLTTIVDQDEVLHGYLILGTLGKP